MNSIAETYRLIGLAPSIAQLSLAKLCVGEPLDSEEARVALECTGRADLPETGFQEVTSVIGRKGGKTEYIAAPILIHRAVSDTDEPGIYLLCAPSKSDQASIGWSSILRGLESGFPKMIASVNDAEGKAVVLHNGNVLRIQSANWRHLRGPKYKVCCVDEACFFVSDDADIGFANPLEYILDSVVGGMVATESPLLLLQSTPWIKDGCVWQQYRDRAANADRLVWQAPTLVMNPYANTELMARHRRDRGENFYQREYQAQFSEDAVAYIEAADVDACVSEFPLFPPQSGVNYVMGLDPGRLRDRFGAAVAHREGEKVIVDWCCEWKPGVFSGLKYAAILPEIWAQARAYGIDKIASDQIDFGGIEASVPAENGVPEFDLMRVKSGGQSGAEICDVTRALFANRKLVLPNQPGLASEFKRLGDFLTAGGGRDIRAKKGFDDRSRAVMVAVYQAFQEPEGRAPTFEFLTVKRDPDSDERLWRKLN